MMHQSTRQTIQSFTEQGTNERHANGKGFGKALCVTSHFQGVIKFFSEAGPPEQTSHRIASSI